MEIKQCSVEQLPLIMALSRQLSEDEKSDNVFTDEELEQRLRSALEKDTEAYLFYHKEELAGYALVRTKAKPMYLWHFYICRDMRRRHMGTEAFRLLMKELNTDTIDLDVYCWNDRGKSFWKSLGFKERAIVMRWKAEA
jgi:ribosomal protein S18 acetylase RimI-like enzyme